ncbi:MAG: ROK family protein [Candidatus Nezhaarchaeota archaeon]|nr:ROK family protein [Candidatus Nezhaarchaeota archaeon]MCX8141829.1 ROK family protein [Candidatus Nezhaarchaeota archaeon]MDW8050390.1 ROK family protein [Nitrososphaerota archaeon]
MDERFVLGIDIGATKIRIGLSDVEGNLYTKKVYKTVDAMEDVVGFIANSIEENFPSIVRDIMGIGIASIGPLDLKKGMILNPPNAPFKNVMIVDALKKRFNVEVLLINDAVAAVWAEKLYGIGRKFRNLVYVTFSSGIGVGVIVDDHLLLGKDGNAHEAGHIVIDSFGMMQCKCGGYGHWEAYCSGMNIPLFARKMLESKYRDEIKRSMLSKYYDEGLITPEALYECAGLGDQIAIRLVEDDIGRLNAAGIASVINCYDPEIVILGGAIALNNRELFIRSIMRHINSFVTNRMPIIEVTRLGEDVVLKGAIAMVVHPPRSLTDYYSTLKSP